MAFLPLAILTLLDFIVMHWTFLPVETCPSAHTLQQHVNMNWLLKSEAASVLFVTTWSEGLICGHHSCNCTEHDRICNFPVTILNQQRCSSYQPPQVKRSLETSESKSFLINIAGTVFTYHCPVDSKVTQTVSWSEIQWKEEDNRSYYLTTDYICNKKVSKTNTALLTYCCAYPAGLSGIVRS